MNCIQVRAMLADYRQLKDNTDNARFVEAHFEECADCRAVLAHTHFVGEHIRSLPAIDPLPNMHEKLMHALAAEHMIFLQQADATIPSVPAPEFLQPYLQTHTSGRIPLPIGSPLAAFSNADTGPIPLQQSRHGRLHPRTIRPFAVASLAAVFLIAVMISGLTALLQFSHDNTDPNIGSSSLVRQTQLARDTYTQTNDPYDHVISAVADPNHIYYTAYTDSGVWMLEQRDRNQQLTSTTNPNTSIRLLPSPVAHPLIVLGSSDQGIVWLQMNVSTSASPVSISGPYSWSLNYQPLPTTLPQPSRPASVKLASDEFNPQRTPSWVHTPVQGVWLMHNMLLVTMIDHQGISHLMRYNLDTRQNPAQQEIAQATQKNLVFTSPTATDDGRWLYWAEEGQSADGTPYSNVWTKGTEQVASPLRPKETQQAHALRSDGDSFSPKIVNNHLFMLSTADQADPTAHIGDTTPTIAPTRAPIPTQSTKNITAASWTDPSFYTTTLDASVYGTLLMFPPDNNLSTTSAQNIASAVSSLQAGKTFLLWQTPEQNGYGMYDVRAKAPVSVGGMLNSASFVKVAEDSDSAVWTPLDTMATTPPPNTPTPLQPVTLMTFNWPRTS